MLLLQAAAALRAVMQGGEEGLLLRLFPNLKAIFAVASGTHTKYLPRMRLLAPTLPVVSGGYVASEGRMGLQVARPFWEAAISAPPRLDRC